MDAYRTAPLRSEPLVRQRAPLRVYVGMAATVALVAAGGAWIGFAFGGWALLVEAPTLFILLLGMCVQIRRNADPRSIAKYRARNEELADAWLRAEDPVHGGKRALRGLRIGR